MKFLKEIYCFLNQGMKLVFKFYRDTYMYDKRMLLNLGKFGSLTKIGEYLFLLLLYRVCMEFKISPHMSEMQWERVDNNYRNLKPVFSK